MSSIEENMSTKTTTTAPPTSETEQTGNEASTSIKATTTAAVAPSPVPADRTSMEGMISNANDVLDTALAQINAGTKFAIPKSLFEQSVGIVLLSVVEAGFFFVGNVGTGIMLRKKDDGTWSNPSACGLTGMGWGFMFGGSVKELIVFILDTNLLNTFSSENGLKIGGVAELTVGTGRTAQFDLNMSGRGFGPTLSLAFTKGAFLGLGFKGAVVGARHAVNSTFYNQDVSPRDILFKDEIKIPAGKGTMLDQVYEKLKQLGFQPEAEKDNVFND